MDLFILEGDHGGELYLALNAKFLGDMLSDATELERRLAEVVRVIDIVAWEKGSGGASVTTTTEVKFKEDLKDQSWPNGYHMVRDGHPIIVWGSRELPPAIKGWVLNFLHGTEPVPTEAKIQEWRQRYEALAEHLMAS
jgi:hypothetical protein